MRQSLQKPNQDAQQADEFFLECMNLIYNKFSLQKVQAFNQQSYSRIQEILADKHNDDKVSEELLELQTTLENFQKFRLDNDEDDGSMVDQDKFHFKLS